MLRQLEEDKKKMFMNLRQLEIFLEIEKDSAEMIEVGCDQNEIDGYLEFSWEKYFPELPVN